ADDGVGSEVQRLRLVLERARASEYSGCPPLLPRSRLRIFPRKNRLVISGGAARSAAASISRRAPSSRHSTKLALRRKRRDAVESQVPAPRKCAAPENGLRKS